APEHTGPLATDIPVSENGEAVEALKAEIPEYTGPLSTNGEDLVVNNVPAYGETGAPAINEVPAYAETGAPAINEIPAYAETGAPAINEVPEYTLTTAGTNKDNTYQAPAAKVEDKKELPNTGGKDNVAVASLGFLGLFLGAIPFVKRKN
ncbi:MAG: LPXTG cell wall anchor domain-containing protein, partial [Streptococcus mitis]|nr:LPXTG cell wall anchor domain-containing protein [Streptococcus mitis]